MIPATTARVVNYVASVEELESRILAEAPPGAMVLMLGAGSIGEVAGRLAAAARLADGHAHEPHHGAGAVVTLLDADDRAALQAIFGERARFDEPLAPYTSWKIGGPADAFVTAESDEELAELLRWCFRRKLAWWVIGSGSNVLVGDGGVRGIVVRLAGDFAASRCVKNRNGRRRGRRLRRDGDWSRQRPRSAGARGIGSLAGIPGTVGGSLRMNAGTDREIGDFVREVWVQSPGRPEPHAVSVRYFLPAVEAGARRRGLARRARISQARTRARSATKCRRASFAARRRSRSRCPMPARVSAILRATRRRV